MLVPVGAIVAIISGLGVLANYFEWGAHSCGGSQPADPVCGSILWLIVEFLILASIGAVVVYFGLGVKLESEKTRGVEQASVQEQAPKLPLDSLPT